MASWSFYFYVLTFCLLEFIKFIDQAFVIIMRYITSHAVNIYLTLNYVVFYYNFLSYWMFASERRYFYVSWLYL
jgi:hypothetical protein